MQLLILIAIVLVGVGLNALERHKRPRGVRRRRW